MSGGRVNNVNHVGGQLNVITIGRTFRGTIIIPIIGHFTVEWPCTYFVSHKPTYVTSEPFIQQIVIIQRELLKNRMP